MKSLISKFDEHFFFCEKGEASPLFILNEFDCESSFWLIPFEKFFVRVNEDFNIVQFYQIFHNLKEVPNGTKEIFQKVYRNPHNLIIWEAYYSKVSVEEIIVRFGKKYKFLLYELDILI